MNDQPLVLAPRSATVCYDEMCRTIALAYSVDEVKDVRDKALAFEIYAKQAKNIEAERLAREIRLRAERRVGELLRDMEKAKGGQPGKNRSQPVTSSPTLANLGISKPQSSRWQQLAAVAEETFEVAVKSDKPSTSGIIAAGAQPRPQSPVDPKALWLWGRLRDFEREVLDGDPNELLTTMVPHMHKATTALASRVAAWLKRIRS